MNVDATRMSQAFSGGGYIQQIVNDEVGEFAARYRAPAELPVELKLRNKFNPNLTSSWFGALMEIINNVTMLSIILTGAALIREKEHGTIEHLLVMPVTPTEIILSKIWSMGLVVLVAAGFSLTFVVQGVLKVPVSGSTALFLFGAALHLFATTSMGIFMAHRGPQHAAVRHADDSGASAPSDAFRRFHPQRKHAASSSGHHAARSDHPLCGTEPGHSLPGRRTGGRLDFVVVSAGYRRSFFQHLTGPLSQDHCGNGLSAGFLIRFITRSKSSAMFCNAREQQ